MNAYTPTPILFSRSQACQIVGLPAPLLAEWESALAREPDLSLAPAFGLAELIALSVGREMSARLGARLGAFTLGLGRLFRLLAGRADLNHLDDQAAVVGRDFALVCEVRSDHLSCKGEEFLVVPLHPLLAELRDRVFS